MLTLSWSPEHRRRTVAVAVAASSLLVIAVAGCTAVEGRESSFVRNTPLNASWLPAALHNGVGCVHAKHQ